MRLNIDTNKTSIDDIIVTSPLAQELFRYGPFSTILFQNSGENDIYVSNELSDSSGIILKTNGHIALKVTKKGNIKTFFFTMSGTSTLEALNVRG